MSQLEDDIKQLANEAITKRDIMSAFKIMGEVTGGLALFGLAATALTVWIPGLGIPISAGIAGKCLVEMGKHYADLPTEDRQAIAKCAKWLHGIVD